MLERVAKTISRYNMLPQGTRVIAAVSGGADSVCLLHVLLELSSRMDLQVEVAHYNHRWRGEESDGDEVFVCELAAKLNLRIHVARAEGTEIEGNREQIARHARQAFFQSLTLFQSLNGGLRANAAGIGDLIATGHTRDDQAETVLFRILRGSGLAGLAGIFSRSRPPA